MSANNSTTSPPPPGWYPDPSGAPGQRYWDGTAWHTAAPQQQKPVSTKKALLWSTILGLVVLIGLINALGDSEDEKTPSVASSTVAASKVPTPVVAPSPAIPPPGSAVRDGQFEFQVLGTTTAKTVDGGLFNSTAQGTYVVVTLKVTNTGDEARRCSPTNQRAFDAAGRRYDADAGPSSWGEDINPGNSIEITVAFDVPVGTTLTQLELHDSMFSGGVKVGL